MTSELLGTKTEESKTN